MGIGFNPVSSQGKPLSRRIFALDIIPQGGIILLNPLVMPGRRGLKLKLGVSVGAVDSIGECVVNVVADGRRIGPVPRSINMSRVGNVGSIGFIVRKH